MYKQSWWNIQKSCRILLRTVELSPKFISDFEFATLSIYHGSRSCYFWLWFVNLFLALICHAIFVCDLVLENFNLQLSNILIWQLWQLPRSTTSRYISGQLGSSATFFISPSLHLFPNYFIYKLRANLRPGRHSRTLSLPLPSRKLSILTHPAFVLWSHHPTTLCRPYRLKFSQPTTRKTRHL